MEKSISTIENLPIKKLYSGKVRELFEIDGNSMLMVTTDRISAFDFILPTPIPEKGKILNNISLFWFDYLKNICPNHVITSDFNEFPALLKPYKNILDGRSIIVKKVKKIPIECIVRGYLSGSGWKEYREKGTICGNSLPVNLKESEKIPEPVFTPSTKEDVGIHDVNISFNNVIKSIGKKPADFLKETSLNIYKKASEYAYNKGIIIADTKFEFGFDGDNIILIDEVLTPDSSRFWEVKLYRTGKSQDSLDKQYIRNYLEKTGWNKKEPAPVIPREVVEKTREKYFSIYKILSG
ncbi:MAG: phosphoribosylaminoimidazolesuccinocarboxamide synthase [Candidatus Omnitrophica bacterium]|nr:phosphoribosylaminoimidazolesuccinocarboxamide synthase [Candidatus Omnitrophota bacterium]